MLERILGQCPPDFSCPYSVSNANVNTRQRQMKKFDPPPQVEEFIKKGNEVN